MKIPRKADLIRLQKLYKSDAKIAEALGGIPEYLVAYWRRKKNIQRHSGVKFNRSEIVEMWERFGDDFRAGRELNISKAAFYGWRRKYEITERPKELRLEQLQFKLGQPQSPNEKSRPSEALTATAKIIRRCCQGRLESTAVGDWQMVPRNDHSGAPLAVCPGARFTWPKNEPDSSNGNLDERTWSEPGWCFPVHGSVVWQMIVARAVLPGQMVLGPRRLLGGLGGIGSLVIEEFTEDNPTRVIRIELTRRLPSATDIEDVFLTMLAHGWDSDWSGATVEFCGGPIERLSVDRKTKLCELTTAAGAQAALCPFDDVIRRHYGRILQGQFPRSHPDRTAVYDGEHFLEGRNVIPQVGMLRNGSGECSTLRVVSSTEKSDGGVVIGPGALPYEIERTAECVKNRSIANSDCGTLLVCPATANVYDLMYRRGWAQTIVAAGGSVLDVALTQRLGLAGLLSLAAGPNNDAPTYVTSWSSDRTGDGDRPVVFAGARRAIELGLRLR